MVRGWKLAAGLLVMGAGVAATAQPVDNPNRGQLLYATHCVACHSAKMHWRANKHATDWASLRAQVRRWQAIQGLGWSDSDIDDVARYLNTLYYRYATPG